MTTPAVTLCLGLQHVTSDADARALLLAALNDGVSGDDLRAVFAEWLAMRASDVTTIEMGESA